MPCVDVSFCLEIHYLVCSTTTIPIGSTRQTGIMHPIPSILMLMWEKVKVIPLQLNQKQAQDKADAWGRRVHLPWLVSAQQLEFVQ